MRHATDAVVGFLATVLTVLALTVVVRTDDWLPESVGVVATVCMLGAAGRAVRLPRPLLAVLQAFVALCVVVASTVSARAPGGFLPGRAGLRRLGHLWDNGVGDLSQLVPPDRATPAISAVLLLSVAGAALVVDVLVGYGRAGIAGLCLVGLYAVPAATLQNGWRGTLFVLPALSCLMLMRYGRAARWQRWGEESLDASATAGAGRATVAVGLVVVAMSLAVPAALPKLTGGIFNNSGIGHHVPEPLRPLDPLWVMRNLLVAHENPALFADTTDSHWPDEEYLHSVTLDSFDGTEWRAGPRTVADFAGVLPPAAGLTPNIPTSPVTTTLTPMPVAEHDYLPVQHPGQTVKLAGKWRIDPHTGDIVSNAGRKQVTLGPWTTVGQDLDPETERITGTAPVSPDLVPYLSLPKLPAAITDEAKRITAGINGAVPIGIRLQEYFRDPKKFTYDQRPAGSGIPAIVAFLTTHRGYAEQYAATMAVMARSLGIPARVVVGFTPGKADSTGASAVRGHDAHAWPELFLPQTGWTRFEPTPQYAPGSPRPLHWLTAAAKPKPQQIPQPQPQQAYEPPPPPPSGGGGGPGDCTATPGACQKQLQPPPAHHKNSDARKYTFLGLLVLLLITGPHLVRAVIRRRRWASITGGRSLAWMHSPAAAVHVADMAWLELRDSAIDLAHAWATARTPRQAGQILAEEGKLSGAAAASLMTVVASVERLRYAPHVTGRVDHVGLRAALIELRRELARPLGRVRRIRAWLWPASLRVVAREFEARLRARRRTVSLPQLRRKARASG
jgi:hypothetical protein